MHNLNKFVSKLPTNKFVCILFSFMYRVKKKGTLIDNFITFNYKEDGKYIKYLYFMPIRRSFLSSYVPLKKNKVHSNQIKMIIGTES